VLLRILKGEADLIAKWRSFGGAECLQSYGVDQRQFYDLDDAAALALVRQAIPRQHVDFLETFVDSCRIGDYLVVHAGIRPGVPVDQQLQTDLRWIRDPFLFDETDHGFVVVHGHTISDEVDERANRIGVDTGAYRSGVLTALGLEGHRRWFVDTADHVSANDRQVDVIACD
jgi:serine/threonine protein phosphatase 1